MGLLFFLLLQTGIHANAQCDVNPVTNQAVCNNTATAAINFTGTATTFNWTNNTTSIGLAASGTGNIASFTAVNVAATAVTATITVTPSTGACTGTPISFTITVNPSPVVNVTPATSCGGVAGLGCNGPLTASGNADGYIWSPLAGLYTNCAMTAPYTGTNLSTVYAGPTTNVIYTVTGTILATGCTNSATAQVYYTPPAPVVTPSSVNMCLGDPPVKLKVTTGTGSTQFCSGTVNIAVPDNNLAGAFSTINVSGISANCLISGMTVTINMPHSNIGDMVFALKAPNGMVINLDYFISSTGGNGPSTGFTNTVFSTAGTAVLATGISPYTGTFKADLVNNGPFGPGGPTGMLPTANNWNSLYPIINGTWTLGFYDGQTGNAGFLTSWCLTFNTSCPIVPATPAVWTPAAGLFADANALIPYVAGTAVDSVWVRPVPAGVYTYQVTTSGIPPGVPVCTSMPRSVVVTVGQVPVVTSQPANVTQCGGTAAVFSATVAGTGPFTYQWQVSSGGATGPYANCANGGVYSGSNTATLTINPVSVGMNGQYYMLRIIGGCGSVNTIPALLTVGVLPSVTITANPLTIANGQTTTIRSPVTPSVGITYTWYYNGSVLPGAAADTLLVQYGSPGDYQLKVTNVCGVATSNIITIANSFALNLVAQPNPNNGRFQVTYYSGTNNAVQRTMNIFNNKGDKVMTKVFTQTIPYQKIDVDVRANGKGIYWVELIDGYGRRLTMNKVVVQ